MKDLSDKCFSEGHSPHNTIMLRAKYLYNSFTSLSGWIETSIDHDIKNGLYKTKVDAIRAYEAYYERSYYLVRTAFDLCNEYISSDSIPDDIDRAYFDGFHLSLLVNYGNLLLQTGRIIKSIEILSAHSQVDFPMLLGNLGLKYMEYVKLDYDGGHQTITCYHAYHLLKRAILSEKAYPERDEASPAFEMGAKQLVNMLGMEYLEQKYTIKDFLDLPQKMGRKEKAYKKWCAENILSLNTLNDVFTSYEVGYDPIHLPNIVAKVSEGIIPHYHGLFNQIKQEYVSARCFAYDGLTNRNTHFSDKGVYLVNTLDYPVYGLSIEKVKAAYRSVYSVFDKVSYFINQYFEIGINKREIDFNRLWSPKASDKKTVFDFINTNYPLLGLWWLYKDIKNKAIFDSNMHIDPVISKITSVRNAMEHRYLKILDFFGGQAISDSKRTDRLADAIDFADFEALTIALLKYAREVIILLVLTVHVEEHNRSLSRGPNEIIPPMPTALYEDDWKRIF